MSSNRPLNPQIQLKNISLHSKIGSQPILQDLSVEVKQGSRIALVGISGAGKTSLLRLLNRLNHPSQGEILFEGKNYTQIDVLKLRQQITLVLSEAKLFGMTVREAIRYPLKLRSLSETEITQRLTEWTERLEIPSDWLNRTEVQLSSGQRQKIALARALVIQPKILLLDEPITALDFVSQEKILSVLNRLTDPAITVILATHHLDLISDWGDQFWHLSNGKLIQDAPTQDLDWQALKEQFSRAQQQDAEDWELDH